MKFSNVWLNELGDRIRGTYLFVPFTMTVMTLLLALAASHLDRTLSPSVLAQIWIIPMDLDPAVIHSGLITLSTSELGVMGVVFSITLVPLTIATSQFGSVLLRVFLRDLSIQIVLGTYCASIAYNLTVLWILSYPVFKNITPSISVILAFILFYIDLAMLVIFFQQIANLLQSPNIIADLGNELERSIEQDILPGLPPGPGTPADESLFPGKGDGVEQTIYATRTGYIHTINYENLMHLAKKRDQVFFVCCKGGDFIIADSPLIRARPGGMDPHAVRSIQRSFSPGRYRTMLQDTQFGISQLVNIAARALSPAMNDPATPSMILNQLEVTLGMIARKGESSPYRYDEGGKLRMIVRRDTFEQYADSSFNLIRVYGMNNPDVLISMLACIDHVAIHIRTDDQQQVLLRHAGIIHECIPLGISVESDRQRVLRAYENTLHVLSQPLTPA